MFHASSQTYLREFEKKLLTSADKVRSNRDAAVYKRADSRRGGLPPALHALIA